jgi:hypothetical protein
MYSQFFGNYLLRKNTVTPEQLAHAIGSMSKSHIKLGTLAIHNGYMSAAEVDEVCLVQTREDKRFGQIAVELGYLTADQVDTMLDSQIPGFLLLGQCLVEDGSLTNSQLETSILDYEAESGIGDMKSVDEQSVKIHQLIHRFFMAAEVPVNDYTITYMELLFNNLIRFVGEDFTPMSPIVCDEYPISRCVGQEIQGHIHWFTRVDMETNVALGFASRYVKENFTSYNEYVEAALEDFINLQNGLFSVNISNEKSIELTLEAPVAHQEELLVLPPNSFVLPISYPFGMLHFIIST